MPTLHLDRQLTISAEPPDAVEVVCEVNRVTAGRLCELGIDPAHPTGPLLRRWIRPASTRRDSVRKWNLYALDRPGVYEAGSAWRSGQSHTVSFEVTPNHEIRVIDPAGSPDHTHAFLLRIPTEEFFRRRRLAVPSADDDLPELQGSPRQREWAETIRDRRLSEARRRNEALAEHLARITAADWWIAWRDAPLNQLPSAELFETSAKM